MSRGSASGLSRILEDKNGAQIVRGRGQRGTTSTTPKPLHEIKTPHYDETANSLSQKRTSNANLASELINQNYD